MRAYSRVVSISCAATTHFGGLAASGVPGAMTKRVPRAPRYSRRSSSRPMEPSSPREHGAVQVRVVGRGLDCVSDSDPAPPRRAGHAGPATRACARRTGSSRGTTCAAPSRRGSRPVRETAATGSAPSRNPSAHRAWDRMRLIGLCSGFSAGRSRGSCTARKAATMSISDRQCSLRRGQQHAAEFRIARQRCHASARSG